MSSAEPGLMQIFADMARALSRRDGVDATVEEICRLAVETIPGCQSVGVCLVHRDGRLETPAASDQLSYDLHNLQYDLREGPCLQAMWTQHTVSSEDLAEETRWPRFSAQAVDRGVRSMLCFQLFTDRGSLGALDMFSREPHGFGEEACETGLIFASHAAVALSGAQSRAHLTEAISSRQRIGEATGILAERHGLTTTAAFAMLAQTSQRHNIKVRELAMRLVQTENAARQRHESPPDGRRRG